MSRGQLVGGPRPRHAASGPSLGTRLAAITLASLALLLGASCSSDGEPATTTTATGTGGSGGSGGGTPSGCVPAASAEPVADSCGVFVSSSLGSDEGDGTKGAPYATIGRALQDGRNVYLCAESFAASVEMTAGVDVFGALDCAGGWAYASATKSAIAGDADAIALRITGSAASTVVDVAVVAPDAVADGASSIAALVDGATVSFERCELTAGIAKAGADGAAAAGQLPQAPSGQPGFPSGSGCGDGSNTPNTPNPDCTGVVGGTGGAGEELACSRALR